MGLDVGELDWQEARTREGVLCHYSHFLRFYQANLFVHLAVSFPKMRGTQVGGRAAGGRVTLRRLGAQQEGFAVPGDAGGGLWLLRGCFLRKDLYLHAPPASPVRFGASLLTQKCLRRGLISAQG